MSSFTRIKPPKYRIGRHILNEYEVRCLQLEVAQGLKPAGIKIKDQNGQIATIRPDGALDTTVFGFDINSAYVLRMVWLNRKKKASETTPS